MKKRAWFYTCKTWEGRLRPCFAGDEYGRHTIVLPVIPWLLWLVVAYKTCDETECREMREQTARWDIGGEVDYTEYEEFDY